MLLPGKRTDTASGGKLAFDMGWSVMSEMALSRVWVGKKGHLRQEKTGGRNPSEQRRMEEYGSLQEP